MLLQSASPFLSLGLNSSQSPTNSSHISDRIPSIGSGAGQIVVEKLHIGENPFFLLICLPNVTQNEPTEVLQRHCIFVAASNPYPLPTLVYRPQYKSEMLSESHLADVEEVAKSFPQSCVCLSVICPKQQPKLKAIYNAGKSSLLTAAPTIGVKNKNPYYLILIKFR